MKPHLTKRIAGNKQNQAGGRGCAEPEMRGERGAASSAGPVTLLWVHGFIGTLGMIPKGLPLAVNSKIRR